MSKQLKLIWDFYGKDAFQTAQHHEIHLKEFAKKEQIPSFSTASEEINDQHSIASIIVSEEHMTFLRDTLKPKRGQWVEEKSNK